MHSDQFESDLARAALHEKRNFFRTGMPSVHVIDPVLEQENFDLLFPILADAFWGDLDKRELYQRTRLGNLSTAPEWLRNGMHEFALGRLNLKSWKNIAWFRVESDDDLKREQVGNMIEGMLGKGLILTWLGLGLGKTHYSINAILDEEAKIGVQQSTFEQFRISVKAGYSALFNHGEFPSYGFRSIFIQSEDGDFLRVVAKQVENFRFAGQLIEDVCNLLNIPLSDEQKLRFAKCAWANPWNEVSRQVYVRIQRLLTFIDVNSEKFRGEKDVSQFLTGGIEAPSISVYLEDYTINLNRRKKNKNNTVRVEGYGKTISMKEYFKASLARFNLTKEEAMQVTERLLHAWRIAPSDSCRDIEQIPPTSKDLAEIEARLNEWWIKHESINRKEALPETIDNSKSNRPNSRTVKREGIYILDTPEFRDTIGKLEKNNQNELIETIYAHIAKVRAGNLGNLKKLTGFRNLYEIRIGGYRIFLDLDQGKYCLKELVKKEDQERVLAAYR